MDKLTIQRLPRYDKFIMDAPTNIVTPISSASLAPTSPAVNLAPTNAPKDSMKWLTPWVVSGVVYLVIFLSILVVLPMDSWYSWKRLVAQYLTRSEYVIVGDGRIGLDYFDINIKRAYLKRPGWLVVSAVSQEYDLRCMQIYGKSEFLPAGKVKNAKIRLPNLTPEVLEETTNQPPLTPGTEVSVGIVYDDGTGSFEQPILLRDRTGTLIFGKTKLK